MIPMRARPTIDLTEATRLTRAGRLDEAMAVLRGAVTGAAAPASGPAGTAPRAAPPLLDMVPPSSATGGAWTAPLASGSPFARRARGTGAAGMPEAVREMMDRMGAALPTGDLGGLPGQARALVPVPDGARFEERQHANAAGTRAYKLYVPSGYTGQPMPLVVMLHGCTQSPDDFAAGTRMNELAEEELFLVAYPAQAQAANPQRCWNWFSPGDQARDAGEPSLIAGITRDVMREFSVDEGRVYIAGLSAGGAAAAIMGAAYPDLYAAIGVHSGLACGAASDMPSAFAAMKKGGGRRGKAGVAVPTIVFHGDRDATVAPVNGDEVIAQSKASRAYGTTVKSGQSEGGVGYTATVHADAGGRAMLEHWVLHGAGHAWSGGSASGSYTDPRGPDASREMLRFFLEHPMDEGAA
jgi:poly(hydroxyalkanoate) depolymerase family esterase